MEDLIEAMKTDTEPTETDETMAKKIAKELKPKLTPKERAKAYRLKMIAINPNWDRERAKKWREAHKDNYYYGQARFFFNKLTLEQKQRLLSEHGTGKPAET
jgi:catalase